MKTALTTTLVLSSLALVSCGGEETPTAVDESGATQQAAAAEAAPVDAPATIEAIDRAFECRALIAGGMASRQVLPADKVPAGIQALTDADLAFWNERVMAIPVSIMSVDERNEQLWDTTLTMYTRQQLEDALPAIESCLSEAG